MYVSRMVQSKKAKYTKQRLVRQKKDLNQACAEFMCL